MPVTVSRATVTLPTYSPQPADPNPMFLERRVYQGSSGKVYPLPFIDRIADRPVSRPWDAVILENEFLYVMILPEIGGRIHVARDKTNGYDFIYRQDVIKPALVGLAGPWASGGIEFNWPQHHRPSTFMPADVAIEQSDDGSVTVWLSDHDPMSRMKGMHGVCLSPGRSVLEVKVRAYNRTPLPQTFLWWANVATRVHEGYQSFFPPDATYVADHAKRAMSEFPLCRGSYYGVDYAARGRSGVTANEVPAHFVPPHAHRSGPMAAAGMTADQVEGSIPTYRPDDLSWYANIPVPTSYMCMGTNENFFGGYDHRARAGLVHVADHHIAPGKKQWTWGNQEFGYAWDRNLTDPDAQGEYAPYIELMAGVFTDNQPDFSFLQPGETKTWTQSWYPIREIGPAHQANLDAAVSLRVENGQAHVGVSATSVLASVTVQLTRRGKILAAVSTDLAPGQPFVRVLKLPRGTVATDLAVTLLNAEGKQLVRYAPRPRPKRPVPAAATEPALPAKILSADELYFTGLHLEQYRHATRNPEDYWREALRRDPGDARCNNALGLRCYRRGEWPEAEAHFRAAIARLTRRNPNPADGEAYYNLGLCLVQRALAEESVATSLTVSEKWNEAYDAFYKATWNQAWQSAGFHALAEIDCRRLDWTKALAHLDQSLRLNTDNLRARSLRAIVLRHLDRAIEAEKFLEATLGLDPLDWWARHLRGEELSCDMQVRLDLAHDYARAGFYAEALALLEVTARTLHTPGTEPLVHYTAAWLCHLLDDKRVARERREKGRKASPEYCFPARLEEIHVLHAALAAEPCDARAAYYLGNLYYDRRRYDDAIVLWEKSARNDPSYSVVWRNLGIAYFNVRKQPQKALAAYERARKANPRDARVLYERDQLWKRLGESPVRRLRELERHRNLVDLRDDLSIELGSLLNQTGRHAEALALVVGKKFQPWEGGEGLALGLHVRTHLALGRAALQSGEAAAARDHFAAALQAPPNLGEAHHPLANQSEILFWLGCAFEALGETAAERKQWEEAAAFRGDFQDMRVQTFSELTYYSARSAEKLGRKAEARRLLRGLLTAAHELCTAPAVVDYFATSLPAMLLFEDDLQRRQQTTALFLEAQARIGLGQKTAGARLLRKVLQRDPNHAAAADLLGQAAKSF